MTINNKYILAPSPEQYYVDKDTGLPLAGGRVEFFSDVNRSTHKPVYALSGSPPNYTYTQLPNPCILSSVGTFQDNAGNNVLPYYYPYDEDGNVELYYITVKSADEEPQFTRQAWPNFSDTDPNPESDQIFNYIPNGQFYNFINIPEDVVNDIPAGQIRQPETIVAYGGWEYFQYPGSTAVDNVQIVKIPGYVSNPTASPRRQIQIQCFSADVNDQYKDLNVIFNDVNKFSSNTDYYTFAFNGITYNSASFNVQLMVVKSYGTGGSPSPQTTTLITTFTFTASQTLFQIPFVFGENTGTQVGTNGDDQLHILLRFPTNISFGCRMTDFMLVKGNVVITEFPPQTARDMNARTMSNPNPDHNGYSIGLPVIVGPNGQGLIYDDSQIGKVFPTIDELPAWNELLCDGSMYRTDAYSPYGIPYRRLQQHLVKVNGVVNPYNMPKFGTGANYIDAFPSLALGNVLMIKTNKVGTQIVTANGAVATPFTFMSNVVAPASSYGFVSTQAFDGEFLWARCTEFGAVAPNGPADSGLIINIEPVLAEGEHKGSSIVQQIVLIGVPGIPGAGSHFLINTPSVAYAFWFKIDGAGSPPVSSATLVPINLKSGYSNIDIAYHITAALTGQQSDSITVTAGNTITPNSYFTFHANGQLYYVWYSLEGAGTDPNVPGGIGITVPYHTGNSAQNIRDATVHYINDLFFATPDFRGKVIKGWVPDGNRNLDANSEFRYSSALSPLPYGIGTYQYDYVLSHDHGALPESSLSISQGDGESVELKSTDEMLGAVEYSGTSQNDVKNVYLNFVIKY